MSLLRRPGVCLALLVGAALLALAGCGSLGHYAQAVNGHLALMNAARPVSDWLQDEHTAPELQARLQLAQQLRSFASARLHLPDNASYRSYATLNRRAVVWNVAAAPVDSLTLKSWCFVVLGCVSYRGYFDEAQAQALGQQLARQGWEVSVYPVPAYSTLGWLNWLGGDPLLSTFLHYPEGDLAGLLFHELAHQRLYVDGDSAFNESFATAVERLGVHQWLATRPPAVQQAYRRGQAHRQQMRALQQRTRDALAALYAARASADLTESAARAGLDEAALLARKAEVYAGFRASYAALRADWAARGEPDARWDAWVAQANNASLGLQQVYLGWVPAFQTLFAREACDWPRFFSAAESLARLPRVSRDEALRQLVPAPGQPACL